MDILVVGATGTLGRQIVRHALEKGYQVKCLVRNPRKATFLKEWGATLVKGDLCQPETLPRTLEGIEAVIDAATARPTDALTIKNVDWDGKVNLIQACKKAGVERYIFFSILNAEAYPDVPLMDIKRCTEQFLKDAELNYTILKPCGFMQGLIPQYAIPILDNQAVWVTGESTPIAYMDTLDIAKFGVRALEVSETEQKTFPLAGSRAWTADEIINLCEQLSGKNAKISRLPMGLLKFLSRAMRFFQWTRNASDRLMFANVLVSGKPFDADMKEVYDTFGFKPNDMTSLETYLKEYFSRIMKKLKEINYEKEKSKKKKTPFKSQS
ncbi:NAD-dependent epimerase/dehydratase family protein [Euhalothece natronophila Z-M001]|uniref:NAD-dependent epimerase/dehydratase family protein n=1 Tax=Euhalothece natronophila Z-M001 TaxID=522448 RepID=A0A5B8NMP7_9CHRO|nr:SDR family oxidoreductase [Euhalothece natronophila]QDZ40583.1 NAD-dependent epimerase/dehydratase family protein [Euhalothece natronophila Z-M001]